MRCVCNDPECDAWFPPNSREPKLGVLNYCFDLNAMHEAEKVLTAKRQHEYARQLGLIIFDGELSVPDFRDNWYMAYLMIQATAVQRAEAFLRTIGKWIDAPTPTIRPTPENTLQKNP
jgi:hypothetical protein